VKISEPGEHDSRCHVCCLPRFFCLARTPRAAACGRRRFSKRFGLEQALSSPAGPDWFARHLMPTRAERAEISDGGPVWPGKLRQLADGALRVWAGTGVVAEDWAPVGRRLVALRPLDMDALPVEERRVWPLPSLPAGLMHACGP